MPCKVRGLNLLTNHLHFSLLDLIYLSQGRRDDIFGKAHIYWIIIQIIISKVIFFYDATIIHLFVQGKKHYLKAAIVRGIHHAYRKNIVINVFLVTMGICQSIFSAFYAISLLWRNDFLNDSFHSDLLIFLRFSLFYYLYRAFVCHLK